MSKLDKQVAEARENAEVEAAQRIEDKAVMLPNAHRNIEWVRDYVQGRIGEGVRDDDAMLDRIIGQFLHSQSVDEILEENKPLKAENVLGEPLTCYSIEFSPSQLEDNIFGAYAAFHITRPRNDQQVLLHCGAPQVVAKAALLDANAEFPQVIEFYEIAAAKEGRSAPLGIRRPRVDTNVPY